MTLSATGRVILGMIRLGRRTGYEIKQTVDRSTRFFWAASYGQIYPELKRLEEQGLVSGSPDPAGGRQRTAYALTPAGEEALAAWLREDAELTFELRDEGLLKLFFADLMDPAERLALVRSMRRHHEQVVERLRAIEPGAREQAVARGREFPLQVLEGGVALHTFIADWCGELERRLAARQRP